MVFKVFQSFLMQNGFQNVPKMHWLSSQGHPTTIRIEKWGSKRPQVNQKSAQCDPKWTKRAPKATPSEPKERPRGANVDLLVFYELSKRPQSTGRMRGRALITYPFGRLTDS